MMIVADGGRIVGRSWSDIISGWRDGVTARSSLGEATMRYVRLVIAVGVSAVFSLGGASVMSQSGGSRQTEGKKSAKSARKAKIAAPPRTWKEHWFEHDQVVKLVNFNDEVAVYFDDDVPRDEITAWVVPFMTRAWRYTKATYGDFGGPESRVFAVFHQGRYSGGHPSTYFDASHDYRNVTDCGPGPWGESSVDLPTHELGHIVEGASNDVHGSPAFGVWKDSKWIELYQYDLYFGLGLKQEAQPRLRPVHGTVRRLPQARHALVPRLFLPGLARPRPIEANGELLPSPGPALPQGPERRREERALHARHELGRIRPFHEWRGQERPQAARSQSLRLAAGVGRTIPQGQRGVPRRRIHAVNAPWPWVSAAVNRWLHFPHSVRMFDQHPVPELPVVRVSQPTCHNCIPYNRIDRFGSVATGCSEYTADML